MSILARGGRDKMADTLQTTFQKHFLHENYCILIKISIEICY